MQVCLFENGVPNLEPLSLTRPVFDLCCGRTTLAAKQSRHFGLRPAGVMIRPWLGDLYGLENPGILVNDLDGLRAGPVILVNGRWLPPDRPALQFDRPAAGLVDEEIAYTVVGPEQLEGFCLQDLDDFLESWKKSLPAHAAGGTIITYPWDLVQHNASQLCLDFAHRAGNRGAAADALLNVVGSRDRLWVDPTAQVDPLVVADTRPGPVVIDREAVIQAFTRLEGPCYVGPGSHVLGARVRGGTTLGPQCRIGGEVEGSIIHSHSNKYHDGFLGHAYLGQWVNLGAGTSNSDLRNDYAPVRVTIAGQPISTGLTKVGCFVGDHAKTGLGTLLNTGTQVGAFAHLLPAGPLAPRYIPSFTAWWNGALRENGDFTDLLNTACQVMRRRGCTLTQAHAALYRKIFADSAPERRRAISDFQQRRLRRSA